MAPEKPLPHELWQQACEEIHGNVNHSASRRRLRYQQLMREHGHLVPAKPGEDRNLPCGWPGREQDQSE